MAKKSYKSAAPVKPSKPAPKASKDTNPEMLSAFQKAVSRKNI
jgi:hypothetical protein